MMQEAESQMQSLQSELSFSLGQFDTFSFRLQQPLFGLLS